MRSTRPSRWLSPSISKQRSAPATILNGVATYDSTSTRVLLPVRGGLPDHDYAIKVVCATSNAQKVLALVAHLPIRQDI